MVARCKAQSRSNMTELTGAAREVCSETIVFAQALLQVILHLHNFACVLLLC